MSTEAPKPAPKSFVGLVVLIAGVIIAVAALGYLIFVQSSSRWPTVDGQIVGDSHMQFVEATGITARTNDYRAIVQYEYAVNGTDYQGSNVTYEGRDDSSPRQDPINAMVSRYPSGQKVTVHYNPDNPADAFLEPADNSPINMGIVTGVMLVLIGVLLGPGLPNRTKET
jgi:hypothetical protein